MLRSPVRWWCLLLSGDRYIHIRLFVAVSMTRLAVTVLVTNHVTAGERRQEADHQKSAAESF